VTFRMGAAGGSIVIRRVHTALVGDGFLVAARDKHSYGIHGPLHKADEDKVKSYLQQQERNKRAHLLWRLIYIQHHLEMHPSQLLQHEAVQQQQLLLLLQRILLDRLSPPLDLIRLEFVCVLDLCLVHLDELLQGRR